MDIFCSISSIKNPVIATIFEKREQALISDLIHQAKFSGAIFTLRRSVHGIS